MARLSTTLAPVILPAMLALPLPCLGAPLAVDPNGACDDAIGDPYCTIGAAVAAAVDGDTINLAAATYHENLTLTTDVELHGAGAGLSILDGSGSARVVSVMSGTIAQLHNLTVQNGDAGASGLGGGIYVDSGCQVSVIDAEVKNNSASDGGAIASSGTLTVAGTRITGNQALNGGGALYVGGTGTATVLNSVVDNNSAVAGGAIFSIGVVSLSNSTVSDNTAFGDGGGLHNGSGSMGIASLTNVTVAGNTGAGGSGGLYNMNGTVTLMNTLVAENSATSGGPDCGGGGAGNFLTLGHNFIGDTTGCAFPLTGSGDLLNQGASAANLGPLADNGGNTMTRALLAGSVAIDGGTTTCDSVDQRGMARPFDGDGDGVALCDIGAFESQVSDGTGGGGGNGDNGGNTGSSGGGGLDPAWLALLAAGAGLRLRRRA